MIDAEKGRADVAKWHAEALARKAVEALSKNGFTAHYMPGSEETAEWLEAVVKPGMTVGLGGSMTIKSLNAPERLAKKGANIIDHGKPGLTPEEKLAAMRAELTSDLFLTSSNAVTLAGEIFNVDGNGNRTAALSFGPKKTVVVVGINKLVRDLAEAEERVKLYAGPMNNKRLDIPNPCAKSGVCADCQGDRRICRVYTILKRRPSYSDFTVIIVGEELGY